MLRTVFARRSISVEVRGNQDRGWHAGSNRKDATATQSGLLAELDTATQSGLLSPSRFDSGLAIAQREWQRRLAAFVDTTKCVKEPKRGGPVFFAGSKLLGGGASRFRRQQVELCGHSVVHVCSSCCRPTSVERRRRSPCLSSQFFFAEAKSV